MEKRRVEGGEYNPLSPSSSLKNNHIKMKLNYDLILSFIHFNMALLSKTLIVASISISAVLSASHGCSGPIHIKSEQDLDSIRHCQTFDGTITIQNLTSESVINLSQLQHVQGDLIFNGNSDLSQVVLAGLRQIDGELKFQENQQLKRLDLTQLTAVRSIDISVEPSLDTILFPSGLSQIEAMKVTDTTANKIEGLTFNKIKDIHIANNVYLKHINMNHLQQINGIITISSNSPNLTLDVSGNAGCKLTS